MDRWTRGFCFSALLEGGGMINIRRLSNPRIIVHKLFT